MADDFLQLSVLEGVSPDTWTGPLELYMIADGNPDHLKVMKDAGAFPWFFDPQFRMDFFRPLSSALLAADHAIFGLNPIGYRLPYGPSSLISTGELLLRTLLDLDPPLLCPSR